MEEKSLATHLLEKFHDDREKMERYSAVAELCPIPIFVVARDGVTAVYVNQAYKEFTGSGLADVQNQQWLDHIYPDDRERVQNAWRKFLEDNVPRPSLRRYLGPGGTVREGTMTVYRVENNGYVGFIVPVCTDHCCFQMASPAGIPPATS